jgi:hypothetical protein
LVREPAEWLPGGKKETQIPRPMKAALQREDAARVEAGIDHMRALW